MNYLTLKNISKNFDGVFAIKNVSFAIDHAEIHGICGENGAGKSTLIKIISGVYASGLYEGNIFLNDHEVNFKNIHDAIMHGIAVIHQEFSLVKTMSVAENIFLGNEPLKAGFIKTHLMNLNATNLLSKIGLNISPNTQVSDLGIGEKQLVEIAKALSKNARLLILDEPTTALTETETDKLFVLLRQLQQNGVTIIYISHRLTEIKTLCNKITVLRDGNFITTVNAKEITEKEIINLMVGREINEIFPKKMINEKENDKEFLNENCLLALEKFSLIDASNRLKIDTVNLKVHKGEILGVAGLLGSGRTELLMGICGAWNGERTGQIIFNGYKVKFKSPADAIANGIILVSEDRKRFGFVSSKSIRYNLNLSNLSAISSSGILSSKKELLNTLKMIQQLSIKSNSMEQSVDKLSGGNQQKVVIGKSLLTKPKLLLLDEPTRGIDVGARAEIYELMNQLVNEGMTIIMVSSDLQEVIGMSHRIIVLREGIISGEFFAGASQEDIMTAAHVSTAKHSV